MKTIYWKQRGLISLWKYRENTHNYPGWNLTADKVGVESLLELCNELSSCISRCDYHTISVTTPTASVLRIPNNKYDKAKWIAPRKWVIRYVSGSEASKQWMFSQDAQETVTLELGYGYMQQFIAGLIDIADAKGDYSIGKTYKEDRLWFWWWPK